MKMIVLKRISLEAMALAFTVEAIDTTLWAMETEKSNNTQIRTQNKSVGIWYKDFENLDEVEEKIEFYNQEIKTFIKKNNVFMGGIEYISFLSTYKPISLLVNLNLEECISTYTSKYSTFTKLTDENFKNSYQSAIDFKAETNTLILKIFFNRYEKDGNIYRDNLEKYKESLVDISKIRTEEFRNCMMLNIKSMHINELSNNQERQKFILNKNEECEDLQKKLTDFIKLSQYMEQKGNELNAKKLYLESLKEKYSTKESSPIPSFFKQSEAFVSPIGSDFTLMFPGFKFTKVPFNAFKKTGTVKDIYAYIKKTQNHPTPFKLAQLGNYLSDDTQLSNLDWHYCVYAEYVDSNK